MTNRNNCHDYVVPDTVPGCEETGEPVRRLATNIGADMEEAEIYFRIERDDRWQNVDILALTVGELLPILQGKGDMWKHNLIVQLCDLLRDTPEYAHFTFQDGTKLEYRQERID